jgi:uncharacterized protein YecA (UPF0149 family)
MGSLCKKGVKTKSNKEIVNEVSENDALPDYNKLKSMSNEELENIVSKLKVNLDTLKKLANQE